MQLEKYADVIVDNPTSSHLHEKRIVNWHSVGIPFTCRFTPAQDNHSDNLTCIILHAPTRSFQKGTPLIEEALKELESDGYDFQYIKIVNKTNQEVLDNIAKCDFVVDELYSDLFMASFATEAASFGKPAIVGIYDYEKVKECINDESMIPPVFVCNPDNVKSAIRRMIVDKEYREELGSNAKKFISDKWHMDKVANRYLLLAEDKIPGEWYFDPHEITRLYGWGLDRERARAILKQVLSNNDSTVLMLSGNKRLEQEFIDFANDK
jgi:glycosyltransferase involved in cell wall biosynthesis